MAEVAASAGQFDSKKDAGTQPKDVLARWLIELQLADKAEEDWRKEADDVVKRVRGKGNKGRGQQRYNIVASNVKTLQPALYAQSPRPDIRPRYDEADPLAAEVAKVLEKSVSFHLDAYDFDGAMKSAVNGILVPGRAVTRVRYKPVLQNVTPEPIGVRAPVESQQGFGGTGGPQQFLRDDTGEPVDKYETRDDGSMYVQDAPYDKKVYEETCTEHVHWDDFRHGPGRAWSEVTWEAFRHKLTREECVEKFGAEIGNAITLDYEPDGLGKKNDKSNQNNLDAFKRAVAWEIWDKSQRKVLWVVPGYDVKIAKTEEDPLDLENFFPNPAPMNAHFDPSNLEPVTDYSFYKNQAEELDIITRRISIITAGLKFRGMYDAAIKGMKQVMEGEDNEFVPVENATAITQNGGLERALFFLPIERAATVLKQLYTQRSEVKQEIFELSGVADIMRGSTNANETLGAQKIKAQWGTQRLQERQRDIQRYARDLIRLITEIIAEKYDPMTLKLMTGIDVTPDMLQIMRLDGPRGFRIDIETDSTIAVDTEADHANLAELTQGLGTLMQALGPMVQGGAMPMDAAKAIVLSIVRRFKLGREVETALDAIAKQPPQQGGQDPAAAAAQQQQAAEQQKHQLEMQTLQTEAQARQAKAQADLQATQQKAASDQAKAQAELDQMNREMELARAQHDFALEELELKRRQAHAKAAAANAGVDRNAA